MESPEDVLARIGLNDHTERLLGRPTKAASIREETSELAVPEIDVFDVGDEDGDIPPRAWLLGNTFCRRYLSSLIAAGGAGKTTLRILQAISLATGRSLTGEHVFVRCRVMIVCLEDDLEELRRRVRAAMLYNNLEPAHAKGFLFLTTPRGLRIAEYGKTGAQVTKGALYHALVSKIDQLRLDLICIDPAVKAHGLDENRNTDIDAFATFLTEIACETNVAVDLLAHERKGGGAAGDVDRGRGASSQKDAARLNYTLTPMSEEEAKALGLRAEERRFLVRVDSAKVNIGPPSTKATWFRLVGVPLGNGTELYPNGDTVQTMEPWTPAPLFDGLTEAELNKALRRIAVGLPDGRRYSTASAAKDRHAWHAVHAEFPAMDEARCKAIVATWTKNKVFEIGEYDDPIRREKANGILSAKLTGAIGDLA
jgi:hypothetical protein